MDLGFFTYALIAFPGFLGLGLAVFILVSRGGNPALHDLRHRVSAVETAQSDLVDRYDHLQRRVATRLARLSKDAKSASAGLDADSEGEGAPTTPQDLKAALRRSLNRQSYGGTQ